MHIHIIMEKLSMDMYVIKVSDTIGFFEGYRNIHTTACDYDVDAEHFINDSLFLRYMYVTYILGITWVYVTLSGTLFYMELISTSAY